MFNTEQAYIECGKRAAKARNESDESRAKHETDYFNRMRLCENMDNGDREKARQLFDDAYRAARKVPKVRYSGNKARARSPR